MIDRWMRWTLIPLLGWSAACAPTAPSPAPTPRPTRQPPPPTARPVLGAILPQSGAPALQQYGDLVLQGMRLAIDTTVPGTPELVVLDDGGQPERDALLVRQLEARGAVGVIGPLLSTGVAAAAGARSDTSLVLISPTASSVARDLPNTYTLNQPDTRGVRAVAGYAAREGVSRMALLYPRTPDYQARAQAFAQAYRAAGGTIVADIPFDSGTTTFRVPLNRVAVANATGLFVTAPERDIRQLAPQISYYGVSGLGVRIFGDESWTDRSILRLVPARYTNGVVASTPLVRESPSAGWQDFDQLYEARYRQTLDTPFPALGYDAARLFLSAIPRAHAQPAQVARALAGLHAFRGASGVLSVSNGAIVRLPFLVRLEAGTLVPIQTPTVAEDNRP